MKQIPVLVVILLTVSLILLIGMSGTGLSVDVVLDEHYYPYSVGHVSITLRNGWWGRSVDVKEINLTIESLNALKWEISNYTASLSPGATMSISANLTIQEWRSGQFSYNLTVFYSQSTFLWFGSTESQQIVNGTITVG